MGQKQAENETGKVHLSRRTPHTAKTADLANLQQQITGFDLPRQVSSLWAIPANPDGN